jgi:DNA polymerase-3 subunit alpha
VLGEENEAVRMAELCRWRSHLLADVEGALSRSSSLRDAASVGQGALFDLGTVAKGKPASSPNGAASEGGACTEHELLANEKEVLGFYLSGHPLARFRKELSSYTTHTLGTLPESGIVRVAGMIVNTKKTVTKTGHAMSRFKLEDLDGELECVVFPKTFTPEIAKVLVAHEMVVVKGRVELRADDKNLLVEEVVPLKQARERFIKKLVLRLSTAGLEDDMVGKIHRLCVGHPGPCRVCFELDTPTHGTFRLVSDIAVAPSDSLVSELQNVVGRDRVELQA